jgi:hypothetical protein
MVWRLFRPARIVERLLNSQRVQYPRVLGDSFRVQYFLPIVPKVLLMATPIPGYLDVPRHLTVPRYSGVPN